MPVGVVTSTNVSPGPGATDAAPGSGYFAVGQTTRGNPTVPVLVGSLPQAQAAFGGPYSAGFLTNDLAAFFGEGGTHAWVQRVVGTGAAAASITLKDTTTGTALNTLTLKAGCPTVDPVAGTNLSNVPDPGAWGNALAISVTASLLANQYLINVFLAGALVETWGPYVDVATAVAQINAGSSFLFATNLFSASTNVSTAVAVSAQTNMTGGVDDPGTVTATTIGAALANFPAALGPGMVCTPGYDASLTGAALKAHAAAFGRIAGGSPTEGMSYTTAATAAATLRGTTGSQAMGYFWPWVTIPNGAGSTVVIPPDGAVAGIRSRTVASSGVWQPPAGGFGAFRFVSGLDPASGLVNDAVGDYLNDNHVNCIRPKAGIRLYGWRSLSSDTINFELLNQQDTLNLLAFQQYNVLQQYVMSIIDPAGQLFDEMETDVLNILEPLITAGALYPGPADADGNVTDPGYRIDTGSDVNTPSTLLLNEAVISTFVRLSPVAELIPASITKVAVSTAF